MVTMPVLTYARYILEFALMEYTLNVETSESLLATAALIVTFKIKGIEGREIVTRFRFLTNSPLSGDGTYTKSGHSDMEGWRETLEYYSGYSVDR